MRVCRCDYQGCARYGVIEGDAVRILAAAPFEQADDYIAVCDLADLRLLAPCQPSKIVAYGINYASHAPEISMTVPPEPLLFLKPSTAVIGPGDTIVLPPQSDQVDYEGELAVVIGRRARNISASEAYSAVFGYTCINDVTARDLQRRDVQFTRAKSFDSFAPLGPWIETRLSPDNLSIATLVNGDRRQWGSTSSMLRKVSELVSFASSVMTLLPGDVIATGTPAGVGPMHDGDTVTVSIEGIGDLSNPVRRQILP